MKLTSIEISGMRSIAHAKLDLDGLTVLIGENGSGKSTILEALEILRRCTESNFLSAVHEIHGGVSALLASGAGTLRIKAVAQHDKDCFEYEIVLLSVNGFFAISEERLGQRFDAPTPLIRFRRGLNDAQVFFPKRGGGTLESAAVDRGETLLSSSGMQLLTSNSDEDAAMMKIVAAKKAFANTQIHGAINTTAAWIARARKTDQPLRQAQELSYTDQLSATYDNLAAVLFGIIQGADSSLNRRVVESLELAFGDRFEGLRFPPAGSGLIQLHAQFSGLDRAVSSRSLSDGQLAYIALVGAFVSGEKRSLLAIDEPEIHLHPALIARMVSMAEITARKTQVVLATHSQAVLDALKNPARQSVLCELNHLGQTVLKRPNPAALNSWLKNYSGLGDLIGAGYSNEVFA